jgi:hypothetical protein
MFSKKLQIYYREFRIVHTQSPLLFISYNIMIHLSQLLNLYDTLLVTRVHSLLRFPSSLECSFSVLGSHLGYHVTFGCHASLIAGGNAKWYGHFGRWFLTKLNLGLPYDPATHISQNELKARATKNLYTNVYSGFICNCQSLKVTKMSFIGGMEKWTMVYPDNGIFFSNKKKWIIKPQEYMEKP